MSGAFPFDPNAGAKTIGAAAPKLSKDAAEQDRFFDRNARLGMSARQTELNRLWARYRCVQYASHKWDWQGRQVVDPTHHDAIASGSLIPPGFYDASGAMVPLQYRKPTAPYHLGFAIVNRFTGMLFSERHHPKLNVQGDPETEDFVHALAETSRLWSKFIVARTLGGAMGSVAVGFKFVNGTPRVEIHDARWCDPVFLDRDELTLASIEKRYQYPVERRDPDTNQWITEAFWYRRVITQDTDTVYEPAPVGEGEEPRWKIAQQFEHGYGFCPVVWIQNLPVLDDIDGDPDFMGAEDQLDAIDCLLAQANFGTLANCDPTLVIKTAAMMADVRKGSDNAIKLPGQGDDAKYLELEGLGAKAAVDLAMIFRKAALEVTQCVLDQPEQAGAVTATEIERRYSAMIEKADILREQYGERGVKPLIEMMVRAARQLTKPKLVDGMVQASTLNLPARIIASSDGSAAKRAERKLGPGGNLGLGWPGYFLPSADDTQKKALAAGAAKTAGLIDQKHASNYVAGDFAVEDVDAMLGEIEQNALTQQAELERMALQGVPGSALGTMAKSGVPARSATEDQSAAAPQPKPVPRKPPPHDDE